MEGTHGRSIAKEYCEARKNWLILSNVLKIRCERHLNPQTPTREAETRRVPNREQIRNGRP